MSASCLVLAIGAAVLGVCVAVAAMCLVQINRPRAPAMREEDSDL